MAQVKRLRVFGGPNGSGKSTLFDEFSKNYNAGYFINADLIEKQLAEKSLIDLTELNIKATQNDLDVFLKKSLHDRISKRLLLKDILLIFL